jgi:hypothetical protein
MNVIIAAQHECAADRTFGATEKQEGVKVTSVKVTRPVIGALAVLAAAAALAGGAGASSHALNWKRLLVTPAQAGALAGGSGFQYYDRPLAERKHQRVGQDDLCSKANGNYNESIEGDAAGGSSEPEDLEIEVSYFASAAAAHRNFRCLRHEPENLAQRNQFDLTNLPHQVGSESFGGGGDNNPIGVVRQGRYVIWLELTNGYGPIGNLMQTEANLVRRFG